LCAKAFGSAACTTRSTGTKQVVCDFGFRMFDFGFNNSDIEIPKSEISIPHSAIGISTSAFPNSDLRIS
jgi:hypothetical protein